MSGDAWIERMEDWYPADKLHALGAVTLIWNLCEGDLALLFDMILQRGEQTAWIITRRLDSATLCERTKEIARERFAALREAGIIDEGWLASVEHVLTQFDRCRRNRNHLTHFEVAPDEGNRGIAMWRRSRHSRIPVAMRQSLADLRRIADELEALHNDLVLLSVHFSSSPQPWDLPARRPLAALLAED